MSFDLEMLGERIRQLRLKKGYSLEKMGKAMGLHYTAITKWETGKNGPTLDNLYELAKFFNVSSDYLLGITDY